MHSRLRKTTFAAPALAGLALTLAACGAPEATDTADPSPERAAVSAPASTIKHVFVVMLENRNTTDIYGSSNAPYLNSLMAQYGYATNFQDVLADPVPSEPHYVWLEAGTNVFSDHTFTSDSDASSSNSTTSTAHLTNQLESAGLTWMSYQEDINSSTGACPISSSGNYAAKHNPFVFFRDVSGSPPSKTNTRCTSHTRPLSQFAADLAAGNVGAYTLITPNLCHDMHGALSCLVNLVKNGDTWLKGFLPQIINYANANHGVVLLTWDEPEGTPTQPFIVIGPNMKSAGYKSTVRYDMSSVLKSMQRIFGVTPLLGHAADASTNDLADFFTAGSFP
jgi:phospholipase C